MKLGLRFLLLLSFLVLGKQSINYVTAGEENVMAVIQPAHPQAQERFSPKAVELGVEDQDEVSSVKKHSIAGNHFLSYTYAPSPVAIAKRHTCSLASSKCFFYSPPDKHILYQVFRI